MHDVALVFDFGNVVAFFDYTRIYERIAPLLGLTVDEFRARLHEEGFDDLLIEFESGRIAPEAFAEAVMTCLAFSMPYEQFVAAWEDIFTLNEPVAKLIEALGSSGYRLLLGSNTNALHFAHYRRQFADTMRHFDRLVASHEVGHMKPAREFYEACAQAAGLAPERCVFIDDIEVNVIGARDAGLKAIQYVDTPSLIEKLAGLGVQIPAGEV
jgi:putative hydrolase of the HAD superfamily